ncbi:MAG: zf-HC2 domain-containing protein [Acidobacteria bacterium]|nr:zf-HC2 domain-containing protein [Acidobacteriota bacterium]
MMKTEATDCHKFEPILDLYLDSQLSPESRSDFERHVSTCARCLQRLRSRQTLLERVRRSGREVKIPPQVAARILNSARRELKWHSHVGWRWGGAVAALCLLSVLSVWLFTGPFLWKAGQIETLEGRLVCMGKMLGERYRAHWDCANYGHLPVIETNSGQLWHLVNNRAAHDLAVNMDDDSQSRVRIVAYVYPKEHFLEIRSYQLLRSEFQEKKGAKQNENI